MTNNPREMAIEALAVMFHEKSSGGHLTHEENKELAAIAIDALNIEIVSKQDKAASKLKHLLNTANIDRESKLWADIMSCINAKPQVYVENIGVKGGSTN